MGRSRLYRIVTVACIAGYAWLAFLQFHDVQEGHDLGVCMIKNITGVPCPSCGVTRSVMEIMKGEFTEALKWNPAGFILFGMLLVSPLWILSDVLFSKDSFFRLYRKAEMTIRNKWIAIPMIILVLTNWIWNILKEL